MPCTYHTMPFPLLTLIVIGIYFNVIMVVGVILVEQSINKVFKILK